MSRASRLLSVLALLCWGATAVAAKPIRILFIGNSLTYSNDMPRMLGTIDRNVVTSMVAWPDYSLEDHLRDGRARKALLSRAWDFVVLQQGPSSLDSSRAALVRDTKAFAALVRESGSATPVLMMAWPGRARSGAFARVMESHRLAAESGGATLVPAGQVLRLADDLPLYAADGFHPSPLGSWAVALTLYRVLVGELPANIRIPGGIAAEQHALLRTAVERACAPAEERR